MQLMRMYINAVNGLLLLMKITYIKIINMPKIASEENDKIIIKNEITIKKIKKILLVYFVHEKK